MNTLIFTANVADPEFDTWKKINKIIQSRRPNTLKKPGYEGMFDWAPKYFDFSKMSRNDKSYIQYEFTEEEWIIFKLRWL